MSHENSHLSFKEAASQILKLVNEPLSAQEIIDIALQKGILSSEGKTPEATMAAQLYLDIKNNENSRFKKVGKGKFSLKEQIDSPKSPLLLIEKQNLLVKETLKKCLYEIDPFQFEFLVGDLLKEIGYEDVEVTKRSGDKGIDINANLTMEGLTNVKTIIQVKRFKKGNNIQGKVIAQLRGSAEVDQRGLVITTSDFTKAAIEESKAPNKMPVALVNGERLIELLIKYGVGVKKEIVSLYSFDDEYFDNEEEVNRKAQTYGKNRALWPMPGGADSYIDTLLKYLERVNHSLNTKKELADWYINNFENVKSENTANGYINVPKSMGLTKTDNGKIVLTKEGHTFLKHRNYDFLYETISENVLAFEEIVEFIKTTGETQTEQDILVYLNENFDIQWTTFAQVNFRLLWLINLGKIKKVSGGYIDTYS